MNISTRNFTRVLSLFFGLVLLLLLSKNPSNPQTPSSVNRDDTNTPVANTSTYLVVKVIDGDTIELENGQKVRYIGIDTPETVKPNTPVQCFGKAASEKNKELVEGKRVRLEKDVSETDRYGRLLRYVWIDNVFVNEYLVQEGYATAVSFPPDIKNQEIFNLAQKNAYTHNKGLWGACDLTKDITN